MVRPVPSEMLDRLQVKERFECWNRDELEPMLQLYAQDAVFDVSAVFTDVAPAVGRAEMLRYWRELRETWGGGLRSDPLELLEAGDRQLVLGVRLWGKGTRSGVEIDQRFAFLYTLDETGKISRATLFPDVQAALAAAKSSAAQHA
jgi:ketosteroid isomerase-like protein